MPVRMSVWDTQQIRDTVREWYSNPNLVMQVQRRDDEVTPTVANRIFRKWVALDPWCDVVVWDTRTMSHKMIQDVFLKDAYSSVEQWYAEIRAVIGDPSWRLWIIEHVN